MKVSIVHPERRTLQSIALECGVVSSHPLPKKLRPATRHELTLQRGGVLEFVAGVGGAKKFGGVSLVIELEAEEGETLRPGCVCYSQVPSDRQVPGAPEGGDSPPVFEVPDVAALARSPGRCSVQLLISSDRDLGIVIANPTEPLPVEGEAHAG